jgi:HTH-type transcriptional regulator / antitoxin HigA
MKTVAKIEFRKLPKTYAGLCRLLMPRPIHDNVGYENTVEMTDAMVLHEADFSVDQRDYFDLLCRLIEQHDAEQVPPVELPPLEALKHLLEQHTMSAADLSRLLGGSRNLGAMILRGERGLTTEHIAKLAKRFAVSPALFIEG